MKRATIFFISLCFILLFGGFLWAFGGNLEGTWNGDQKVLEIWWCEKTQSLKFDIYSNDGKELAKGTVEEAAGTNGTSYVFVTDDSRIFQAQLNGDCEISVGQFGNFEKEDCSYSNGSNENSSQNTQGFNPCDDTGVAWNNIDQPGMYVYFSEYFDECQYELYVEDELVDKGKVEVNGNNLTFVSDNGKTTTGQVLDECSFQWGQAGKFQKEECETQTPAEQNGQNQNCQPVNTQIPGAYGGYINFNGQVCGQANITGTVTYQNYTIYSPYGSFLINGQIEITIGTYPPESPQMYSWYINGGPIIYSSPQVGQIQVQFDNVEFITNLQDIPIDASGTIYINGYPYQVSPQLFYYIFGTM